MCEKHLILLILHLSLGIYLVPSYCDTSIPIRKQSMLIAYTIKMK